MFVNFNTNAHVFTQSYVSVLGAFFLKLFKLQTQFMSFKLNDSITVPSTNQHFIKNINSHWQYVHNLPTSKRLFLTGISKVGIPWIKNSQKEFPQLKRSPFKTLSNNLGQITIVMLPIFVVLLTIATGVGYSTYAVIQKTKRDTYCHHVLLKLNSLYKDRLKDLYSLNKKINGAQKNYSVAQKAMVAALASGQPAAIASAKYYLNFVKAIMYKLKYEQFIILKNSYGHFIKAQLKFKNSQANWTAKIKPLMVRPIKRPIVDIYRTVPLFKNLQTSSVTWRHRLSLLTYKFEISGSCKASLIKKGSTWQPIIKTDRL